MVSESTTLLNSIFFRNSSSDYHDAVYLRYSDNQAKQREQRYFVNLYQQRAISKGWEDFLQSEAPDRAEGESEAEYNRRKASAMYDLLSSISPDILPCIQQGANTPYQIWENIKNFGQECKTIRETTIRRALYNLNLEEPAAFEWWSSKMYSLFSELVVLTGTDVPNAEKVSIILINLGGTFHQLHTTGFLYSCRSNFRISYGDYQNRMSHCPDQTGIRTQPIFG